MKGGPANFKIVFVKARRPGQPAWTRLEDLATYWKVILLAVYVALLAVAWTGSDAGPVAPAAGAIAFQFAGVTHGWFGRDPETTPPEWRVMRSLFLDAAVGLALVTIVMVPFNR
jgi:hypothetical protein